MSRIGRDGCYHWRGRGPCILLLVSRSCPFCRDAPELVDALDLGVPVHTIDERCPEVFQEFGIDAVPAMVVVADDGPLAWGPLHAFGQDAETLRRRIMRMLGSDENPSDSGNTGQSDHSGTSADSSMGDKMPEIDGNGRKQADPSVSDDGVDLLRDLLALVRDVKEFVLRSPDHQTLNHIRQSLRQLRELLAESGRDGGQFGR